MARTALQDPLKVFRFTLIASTIKRMKITEVTGLKKTTDIAETRAGGENETPQKSAGLSHFDNVTLKRAQVVMGVEGDDDFVKWVRYVNRNDQQGNDLNYRIDFECQQANALVQIARRWEIYEAWPCESTPFTDLNGMTSDNSFETIVLANEGHDLLT